MIKIKKKISTPAVDPEKIRDVLNAMKECELAIKKVTEELNKKYNKRVKFNLELIIERAVDAFYESYEPNKYNRQFGLYDAKEIIVNDDEWSFNTGAEYMTTEYKVPTEYIYINSFEQGWHGGAVNGKDKYETPHPSPGTPYWMLHGEWYKPATRMKAPYPEKAIADQGQKYIDEQEEAYENEWKKLVTPYYNKVMDAINNLI